MPAHNRDFASVLALAVLLAASPGLAATIEKADNTLPLNDPGSWVGGVVPLKADVAVWDSTITGPNAVTLGADDRWSKLQITNPGGDVTILDDGHTLALDTGIDMSTATVTLTLNAAFAPTAGFVQNWNVNSLAVLNGSISNSSGASIFKTGNGTVVLGGASIYSPSNAISTTISAGTIQAANPWALHFYRESIQLNSTTSTLDLGGHDAVLGGVFGAGSVTNNGAAPATLAIYWLVGGDVVTTNFSDGSMPLGVIKEGVKLVHWSGVNTYSGKTTVARGTLDITGTSSVASGSTLVFAGGALTQSVNATQSFAATVVTAGASQVSNVVSGSTASRMLDLGAITRTAAGGTVDFSGTSTGGIYTSTPLTSSGILGGWATILGQSWATRDTASASSPIVALAGSSSTSAFGSGLNTQFFGAGPSVAPNAATGSVAIFHGTLTLNGANVIESGGILVGPSAATSFGIINGDSASSLTSGNGHDLIAHANAGPLTIDVAIVDNAGTPIALTKDGISTLTLSGANTYSGGTFLSAGKLVVAAGSSLGAGPVAITYEGGNGVPQLILGPGVVVPGNITASDGGFAGAGSLVNVPTGSATLAGNYATRAPDQYKLYLSGGALTLLGTHTAGTPNPNEQSPLTLLGGTSGSAIVFAGTGSLTSYGAPIVVQFDVPTFSLTVRDDAFLRVVNASSSTGLDLGNGIANNGGTMTLSMADRAFLDLGTSALDILHSAAARTILNLDGGSLRLGSFVKSTVFAGNVSTINFNGTTIVAAGSSSSFLPAYASGASPTLLGIVRAGGARFDTNGHSVGVSLPLSHDAALGGTPDGGVTKVGIGSLALNGVVNYSGATTIAQGTLSYTGSGTASSVGIITGPGDLRIGYDTSAVYALRSDGVTVGTWSIRGIHAIRPGIGNAGTSKVSALTIETTPANQGRLDLTDSKLIVEADPGVPGDKAAKLVSLEGHLLDGVSGGFGITSSTVAADQSASGSHMTALALYDNAVLKLPTFGGQQVDDNSLLVTTALAGDANFDNVVDLLDASIVANHWQSVQHSWSAGDLNDDGFVDLLDLTIIANHWQQHYTPPAFAGAPVETDDSFVSLPESVPEPASLALLCPMGVLLLRRARSRGM